VTLQTILTPWQISSTSWMLIAMALVLIALIGWLLKLTHRTQQDHRAFQQQHEHVLGSLADYYRGGKQ
jgi:uncharacterized membrane-anchored protein YhcB (DUF1043 family)